MTKTRISLFYLASYLLIGGTGFFIFPRPMLRMFLSQGNYSDVMLQLIGLFMISLGIIIVQIIRHRIEQLCATTLLVRSIILISLPAFYFMYKDPLMLVLFGIVGLGFLLTVTSYLIDKKVQRIIFGRGRSSPLNT